MQNLSTPCQLDKATRVFYVRVFYVRMFYVRFGLRYFMMFATVY